MVSDDISPLLQKNLSFYQNPSAISIKSGAFKIFNSKINGFNTLQSHYVNEVKGKVKYVPPKQSSINKKYTSNKVVLVNYNNKKPYKLEKIDAQKALNVLIPESWISSKKHNAKSFFKWVKSCHFYELTYHKTEDAIASFDELFDN